jgi:hypothetical protein
MRWWYDNIKMNVKENSFVLTPNYSLQNGENRFFKVNEVILHKILNDIKNFTIEFF